MFGWLHKPALTKVLADDIYTTERKSLEWQLTAETYEMLAAQARVAAETMNKRAARLKVHAKEINDQFVAERDL